MAKPVRMRDALGKALRSLGLEQKIREAGAAMVWSDAVGERVDRVTQVTAVKDGVVHVSVANSMWRQELSLMKTEIIRGLNDRLGRQLVKDIQFH